jgi:hypothetical protein
VYKGRQGKKKRETDVHLRQLAKKSTRDPFILGAFLGVLGRFSARARGVQNTREN